MGVYRGGRFWSARGSIVAVLLLKQIWRRLEFYITILTQYLLNAQIIGYRITSSSWSIPGALLEFGVSHVRGVLTLNDIILLLNSAHCPMILIRHGVMIEALEKKPRRVHNEDIIQREEEKRECSAEERECEVDGVRISHVGKVAAALTREFRGLHFQVAWHLTSPLSNFEPGPALRTIAPHSRYDIRAVNTS